MQRVGHRQMQAMMMAGGGAAVPWWETDANLVGFWSSIKSGAVAPTGTWPDFSTQGNNGTLHADAYVDSGGLRLDGLGDYVSVTLPLPFSTGATISFWLNLPQVTSHRGIFDWGDAGDGVYIHRANATNIKMYMLGDNWAWATGGTDVTDVDDGSWSFWTFVTNSANIFTYKQGENVASKGATPTDMVLGAIGKYSDVIPYYSGSIDDVMVFSRALTPTEVGEIYAGQAPHYA